MFFILQRALVIIFVLLIFLFLLEKGVNKLLGVRKRKVSETLVKRLTDGEEVL
jgi:hypothetical protein